MQIRKLGEIKLLEKLIPIVFKRGANTIIGPGDDCAVVRLPQNKEYYLLLKTDAVIETVHFLKNTPANLIGRKALGKVLSDIAAMGGKPLWALISLVATPKTELAKLKAIYYGIRKLASQYDVEIVGGETSRGKLLELHIFCAGITPKNRAVLRKGAKAGDMLFVTGTLGGSIYGKHLEFQPRIYEGMWLAENNIASSMIDITDGLLLDLTRLLNASKKSCQLYIDKLPISPTLLKKQLSKETILKRALTDGEDFELLFSVPEEKIDLLKTKWKFKTPITMIGEIKSNKDEKVSLFNTRMGKEEKKITIKTYGYEHFKE